jgi:hypothetical protein
VKPPVFTRELYVRWDADLIKDPLLQEWIDYRCRCVARSYEKLAEYCRSLHPDIALECNPTGIWGENSAYMRSVDHARLLPAGDFFWDESPNPHGLLENGALSTNIRSMKLGEATGNRTFFYVRGDDAEKGRLMGEALAFNRGCLGMVCFLDGDRAGQAESCRAYVDFLQRNREEICSGRSLAQVAVYRNFASLAYDSWSPHLQTILAEQALLQNHIPFDFIFDLERAGGYEALVVAGMQCMSDSEIDQIRQLAASGTNVVLCSAAGRCDEWQRPRPEQPLRHLANIKTMDRLKPPARAPDKSDRRIWDDYYRVVDARFWGLPENEAELVRDLPTPIRTNLPSTTVVEPRVVPDKDLVLVHIINYSPAEPRLQGMVEMRDATRICAARCLQPGQQPADVSIHGEARCKVQFSGPYALLRLSVDGISQ